MVFSYKILGSGRYCECLTMSINQSAVACTGKRDVRTKLDGKRVLLLMKSAVWLPLSGGDAGF